MAAWRKANKESKLCKDASLSDLREGRNRQAKIKMRMTANIVMMATRSPLLKENHLRKDSIFYCFGPFDRLRDPRQVKVVARS